MIDVVYVVGTGSKWNDEELRYSLRCLEKYTRHRNVYIIGHKPHFVQNVIHVPQKDTAKKEASIAAKVCTACIQEDISQEFLFMNDDHFIIKDVDIDNYPFYHQDKINVEVQKRLRSPYRDKIERTRQYLGDAADFYDIHVPIRYDKTLFPIIMTEAPWNRGEMVVKSLYANKAGVKGTFRKDIKLLAPRFSFPSSTDCFSIGERLNFKLFQRYMNSIVPEKSIYEK